MPIATYSVGGQWGPATVIDLAGRPQPGAVVALYLTDGATLAVRYTDSSKATPAANPWTADTLGSVTVVADPGPYILKATVAGVTTPYRIEVPVDPVEVALDEDVAAEAALRVAGVAAEAALRVAGDAATLAGANAHSDALFAGFPLKYSVKAAATAPLSGVGLPVVDGYQTADGDLILAPLQADPIADGIYQVHAGGASPWTRPADFATGLDVTGAVVAVEAGAANGQSIWLMQGAGPIIVGTTPQVWVKVNAGAAPPSGPAGGDLGGFYPNPTVPALVTLAGAINANAIAISAETNNRTAADATLVPLAQKGAANGVATLDSGTKIPAAQLPSIAITDTFVVASQVAMLALVAQTGDVAVRTDLGTSLILQGADPTVLSNWVQLDAPGGVVSVAGRTGAVTLAEGDVAGLVADLGAKAADSAVVHNSGNENVAGIKTFTSAPVVPDGSFTEAKVTNLVADLAAKEPKATYNVVSGYGADPTGVANSTTPFNNAIAAATGAGGGIVRVPFGVYKLTNAAVFVLSNVTVVVDPGTSFFPADNTAGPLFTLATASFAETVNYSTNCGIVGGPFFFDYTLAATPGGTTGQRGISVFNAKNWVVDGARGKRLDMGSVVHISLNGGGLAPSNGSLRNSHHEGATNDNYGVVQVTAGAGLQVSRLYADRGVTLRIENDGQHGPVSDVFATGIRNIGGQAAAFLTAHFDTLTNIRIHDFYAKSCTVAGVSLSTSTGASMGDITIADGLIEDCLGAVGPVGGSTVLSLFGNNKVKNVTARRCTDSVALRVAAGFDYEDCLVEDSTGGGVQDATNQPGDGVCKLVRVVSRRNTGGGFTHTAIKRVEHWSCEAYDDKPWGSAAGTELLTANQQSIESVLSAADWVTGGGSSVAQTLSDGFVITGTGSLLITSTAAGTAIAQTPAAGATGAVPVAAGTLYAFKGKALAALEGRSFRPTVTWYDVSNVIIGSTVNGPITAIDSAGPTWWGYTVTSPAGATSAVLGLTVLACAAAGEQFVVDDLSFRAAAAAMTQTYGVLAVGTTRLLSVASRYGPNLNTRVSGSQATHTYQASREANTPATRPYLFRFSQATAVIGASGTERMPQAGSVARVNLSAVGGPVGSDLVVQVRKNGSAFATLTMTAGTTTPQNATPGTTFVAGDLIDINVTSVGSGTAATGIVVQFDAVVAWEVSRTTPPSPVIQASALSLPGTAGVYASSPNMADAGGDLDIRLDVAATNWSTANVLLGKTSGGGTISWRVAPVVSGKLELSITSDGTTNIFKDSTVVTGIANGARKTIRVTVDVDNGAGGWDVKFWLADSITGPFTQLGTTVTTATPLSRFTSASTPYKVGANVASSAGAAGNYYRAQVRSNILDDGTGIVYDFNPAEVTKTATRTPATYTDSKGVLWTLNGSTWDWV